MFRLSKSIIFYSIVLFTSGALAQVVSIQPQIDFSRQLTHVSVAQPNPFQIPSSLQPDVQTNTFQMELKRLLYQPIQAIQTSINPKLEPIIKAYKNSSRKPDVYEVRFKEIQDLHAIYFVKNEKIIGYALVESVPFYMQSDFSVMPQISQLSMSPFPFIGYSHKKMNYGKIVSFKTLHDAYIEHYGVYYPPTKSKNLDYTGASLVLDAFYPAQFDELVKNTIYKSAMLIVEDYNNYYKQICSNPENCSEMDGQPYDKEHDYGDDQHKSKDNDDHEDDDEQHKPKQRDKDD